MVHLLAARVGGTEAVKIRCIDNGGDLQIHRVLYICRLDAALWHIAMGFSSALLKSNSDRTVNALSLNDA